MGKKIFRRGKAQFILVVLGGIIILSGITTLLLFAAGITIGPYFEVGMNDIYKEVAFEEAIGSVAFTVFYPRYLPSGMPPYKVALLTRPEPNSKVAFFTPKFPGVKPGPLKGLVIMESLKDLPLAGQEETFILNSTIAKIFSFAPHQSGWRIIFSKDGTNIEISWFGKEANKEELIKVAKSMGSN